jgi:membrane associated rhomboid family serine protease
MPRRDDPGGPQPGPQLALPRLTPAVKVMLIGVIALFVIQLLVSNWMTTKVNPFIYVVLFPSAVIKQYQVWRLLTWPLVQPADVSDLLWACAGLYFFATDLETAYGTRRFLLFSVLATVLSGLVATLYGLFHSSYFTEPVMGLSSFGFALTAAWGVTFPHKRLFFPPVSARVFVWIILGIAVLSILARASRMSPAASLGSIAVGYLLGKYWGRIEDILDRRKLASLKAKRDRGLRVLPGGKIDDRDLKNRKPVDKRFLN